MLCLSRIERSTAAPNGNAVITCRLRDGNFENWSLAEFGGDGPILSPGIARATVWVGLGAVARSRGIGWRSGLAAVFGVSYNRHVSRDAIGTSPTLCWVCYNKYIFKEPNDVSVLYNKDVM